MYLNLTTSSEKAKPVVKRKALFEKNALESQQHSWHKRFVEVLKINAITEESALQKGCII